MLKLLIGVVIVLLSSLSHAASYGFYTGKSNGTPADIPRDPFTTSNKMYGEIGIQAAQKASVQQGFVPGYGVQGVPKMKLKGFVTKTRARATALLEIEGAGVYMVSKGDEVGLHSIGQNVVLKIIDVSSNGVKVQSGQVNQVIVVR
ncbi:MAG TPA: hypothetical protein DCO68_01315 [Methylophilaceae bacterium]|nr:hypothetical protein [Methylophilaceae bacterium]HAJ70698.1 hypothetical protein [Methylophilaceae bacterium]